MNGYSKVTQSSVWGLADRGASLIEGGADVSLATRNRLKRAIFLELYCETPMVEVSKILEAQEQRVVNQSKRLAALLQRLGVDVDALPWDVICEELAK